jgi:hypothetical protein
MMQTVGDSLASLAIPPHNGGELIVVRFKDGKPRHYRADEVASKPLKETLYLASGVFAPGSVTTFGGRTAANVEQILWFPFDADLSDFLGQPRESLYALPQAEIDAAIADQRMALEEAVTGLGLIINRLDYTGYGLCAYIYLPQHQKSAVETLQALHKGIVERINTVSKIARLVDPQVSDAGPRITRVPGSWNTKGPAPRIARTLSLDMSRLVTEDELRAAAVMPARTMGSAIPRSGSGLPDAMVRQIVDLFTPLWTEGNRHRLAMGLSGRLAKAGVPEEQALGIVDAISAGDAERWDRQRAVSTSYDRARSGLNVVGYTWLRDLLPAEGMQWLDDELGRWSQGPRVTIGGTRSGNPQQEPPPAAFSPDEVPSAARYGWIGEYVDLVEPTTEAPIAFHVACGLTLMGCTIGRRVCLYHASDRMYPNLFTLLVGPSGRSRKDTAIRRSLLLPQLSPPVSSKARMRIKEIPFQVVRDVASAEGLIAALAEHNHLYLYASEFSKLMHNATREATRSIQPTLIDAFDNPFVLQNKTKKNPLEAKNPSLTIMAATQPDILSQIITPEQEQSGFLNRWLFIVGDGTEPRPSPPDLDEAAAWHLFDAAFAAIQSYAEGETLRFSDDALERWDALYIQTYNRGESSAERSMAIRLGTMIKKVALIHAVLEQANAVELKHLEAAIALVEWSWEHMRRLIPTWGEFPDAKLQRLIVEILHRKGPLTRRKCQQSIGHRLGPGKFAAVVKAMLENGELIAHPDGTISVPNDEDGADV